MPYFAGASPIPQPVPRVANASTSGTTELVVLSLPIPANTLQIGSTFRFSASGNITGTGPTLTARLRVGTLGTTGDTSICVTAANTLITSSGWQVEGWATVRTIGAAGTVQGTVASMGEAGTGASLNRVSPTAASVAINTTVANVMHLDLTGGGTTPVINILTGFVDVVRV